jgi:hypothetical protein
VIPGWRRGLCGSTVLVEPCFIDIPFSSIALSVRRTVYGDRNVYIRTHYISTLNWYIATLHSIQCEIKIIYAR